MMRKTIGALLLGILLIEPDYALAYIDPSAGGLRFNYYWEALPVLASWSNCTGENSPSTFVRNGMMKPESSPDFVRASGSYRDPERVCLFSGQPGVSGTHEGRDVSFPVKETVLN